MAVAPVGHSVTIALPPARPVAAGPRLERLSLHEVALFTGVGPHWKRPLSEPVHLARRLAPAVQMALRSEPVNFVNLRILNAARVEKLAARTRSYLGRFGWSEVAVASVPALQNSVPEFQ